MSRILFGALGAALAVAPNRVRDIYERTAFEAPSESAGEPWLPALIRTEGIAFVAISLIGGKPYERTVEFVGAVGLIAAIAPRRYLNFGAGLGYEDPGEISWNDGFVTAVRGLGLLFALFALRQLLRRN